MKQVKFILFFLILGLTLSCSSDSDDVDDDGSNPPANNNVTYTSDIAPIMTGSCIRCHATPPVNNASISLTTYTNVRGAVLSNGLIAKVERGAMPPTGPDLTQEQVQLIKDWQKGGFKE
jgi:uncharacterized membrane protein